jgi:hypothetical protein
MSIAVETGKQLAVLVLVALSAAALVGFYVLVASYIATWGQ